MAELIRGRALVAGAAQGELLASTEPLSFWGGYDQLSGEIIDRRHPLSGCNAAGKVLVLPLSRGSSTTTAVLLEAVRLSTAPAALLTDGVDTFLTLASVVAAAMYGRSIPIIALESSDFDRARAASSARVHIDGTVELEVTS